ncbi:MAG TPA: aldo/keto reductase family protein [Fibrobacteria bacterium]|nr:aldo/keto reductase family protein [Fibrobacteria bacterium]
MKYRKLGATGLVVSEITYGSWLTFGNQVELDSAKALVQRAFDLGINSFDTADVYKAGEAERLLGQILPKHRRSEYVLATKAFWPMSDHPTDRGLSRKHLFDSIDASLDRLNLKYVDLFYAHRFDPETPLAETCEAFDDLIRLGRILYWGTSEWTAAQIREAHTLCRARGWHAPVVNQPYYNLLGRGIEAEIVPTCMEFGMGTANFSPLAQGVLSGKYSKGKIPTGARGGDSSMNMWMKDHLGNPDLLDQVDRIAGIAAKHGCTASQVALAWILTKPGISTVIVGASNVAQLEENAKASGLALEAADLAQLEIWFPRG